jgi:putative transposase
MDGLQFFDRDQNFTIAWRSLPHWSQAGTVCFITWRTADSLPRAAQQRIALQRRELLARLGLDPAGDWAVELGRLPPHLAARARWNLFAMWDRQLDRGIGACELARPEVATIVEQTVRRFDGERYALTDLMVMPNHVHLLVAFAAEDRLLSQVAAWKRFAARQINPHLGRRGSFWQIEHFDHLVRSPEQFAYLRRYIADNPRKAGLREGQYRHYAKVL